MTTPKIPSSVLDLIVSLPTQLTLKIEREGEPSRSAHFFTDTDAGCWLVQAPMSGCGGAWGRSEVSVEDAVRNCLKAGGKVTKRGKPGVQLLIYWQPREAWERHAEKYPDRAPEVSPPGVYNHGGTFWWGSPGLYCLYAPDVRS